MQMTASRAIPRRAGGSGFRQDEYLDRRFLGFYSGGACIVIAGGPSVADYDLTEFLPGRFVAVNVVNYAEQFARIRKHCAAGIIMDESLLRANLRRLIRTVEYPIFTGNTAYDSDYVYEYLNDLGVYRIPSNNTEGLGDSFGRFSNGGNSGFAGIQLALLFGFTDIGLLGFDGAVPGRGQHFHSMYSSASSEAPMGEWCELLDVCAPLFDLLGVRLWNLSSRSRLSGYPKIDAAQWRAVAGKKHSDAHVQPAVRLREKYGGRVHLPFGGQSRDNNSASSGMCYGGARNLADPGRYCPIPSVLEPFVSSMEGGYRLECGVVDDSCTEVTSVTRDSHEPKTAFDRLVLVERSCDEVDAWIEAASMRVSRVTEGWIQLQQDVREEFDKPKIELNWIIARIVADDVGDIVSGVTHLRGSIRGIVCGINSVGLAQGDGVRTCLRELSKQWHILEYRSFKSWLAIAMQPT